MTTEDLSDMPQEHDGFVSIAPYARPDGYVTIKFLECSATGEVDEDRVIAHATTTPERARNIASNITRASIIAEEWKAQRERNGG